MGKAWDETSGEDRCWVDALACATVDLNHILYTRELRSSTCEYIRYGYTGSLALFLSEKLR